MKKLIISVFYVCLVSTSFSAAAQVVPVPLPVSPIKEVKEESIGTVILAKGVVTSNSEGKTLSILSKGSDIYRKDVITTANKSFVVIRFSDGGKTTLRPNSELVVNEYNSKAGQETKAIQLLKGGLRSVTGAIGKARPKSVKYRARNLTIGIRGTEFVLVLCDTSGVCSVSDDAAASTLSEGGADSASKDIFVNNKLTGEKQKIDRETFKNSLDGIYVSVEDGEIRLEGEDFYIDMPVGESCLAGGGSGIGCFKPGVNIEDVDIYLSGKVEGLAVVDLLKGAGSISDKKIICEII